jgi:hypothetical protein
MNDFDALLKRSFAEAHEPADDGFAVQVSRSVARNEAALKVRNAAYSVGMAAAAAAIVYGGYGFVSLFGQEMLASAGLEVARVHSAMSSAPTFNTQSAIQSLSAGLGQMLLVFGALAGGAVAYRAAQD